MRELKQNWRDIFLGFKTALGFWQIVLAFVGLVIFFAVAAAIEAVAGKASWVLAIVFPAAAFVLLVLKMLAGESGLTRNKAVLLGVLAVVFVLLALLFCLNDALNARIGSVCTVIWALVVGAFFGGAIARIAVVKYATNDTPPIGKVLKFAGKKYTSNLGAPLAMGLFIYFFYLCIMLGSLVMRVPAFIGTVLGAVLIMPLVLLAGVLIAIIAIGLIAGFGMMYPTIGAEGVGSDAFEAVSQAYGFVFTRPLRYFLYVLLALLIFAISAVFVLCFTSLAVDSSVEFIGAAGGQAREVAALSMYHTGRLLKPVIGERLRADVIAAGADLAEMRLAPAAPLFWPVLTRGMDVSEGAKAWTKATAWVVAIYATLLYSFAMSFLVSLFFSLSSIIYLLMRKEIDGTDVSSIYLEEKEEPGLEELEEELEEKPAEEETPEAETPAEEGAAETEQADVEEPEPEEAADDEEEAGDEESQEE